MKRRKIQSMKEPIISVSGLRGIIGSSLTPEIAIRYVGAFVATLPPGPVVVTRDGRASGPMLLNAIQAALAAAGVECLDGGIAATPTTGVLVRQCGCVGGIQISASHNPFQYNGMKLMDATGRVIPADAGQEVLDRYHMGSPEWQSHDRIAYGKPLDDSVSHHLALVETICDGAAIRRHKFRVLLDANNGSGSVLGVPLLEKLGCQVTLLGGTPDGQFTHLPEPTADHLASVLMQVVSSKSAIGFCQDPDADRLAVIDETGRYIGEEYTPALCADHRFRQTLGPVVTNCSTSRMISDLAKRYGVPFHYSRVGEAHVVDVMIDQNAVMGAEGNGGVIDPRVGMVRDSFVGMALILDAMASRGLPVSGLADELPCYAIHKTKVAIEPEHVHGAIIALEGHFSDASASRLDGLRLDWPNRWLLVRASNTEPIMRIIAEAPQAAAAERLCQEAEQVMGG